MELQRRAEPNVTRTVPARGYPGRGRVRYAYAHPTTRRTKKLQTTIDDHLFKIIIGVLVVGAIGFAAGVYIETRSVFTADRAPTTDSYATSIRESFGQRWPQTALTAPGANLKIAGESASIIIAREWDQLLPVRQANRTLPPAAKPVPTAKPPVRVASADAMPLRVTPPRPAAAPVAALPAPSSRVSTEAKTSLVDFETAPFPYHGTMPGSDRPFLNSGDGHANFRGHVYPESATYSDDHVLLHIPPGFDIKRPAVMVVFFHGHGAELARDVRDRQELPAQITAAGMNAVLVAPQFAFNAADSSAGKFWEPDGFRRFLDEAAQKLATMYGDPRGAQTFANMPIVLVAYSGGFGPTLAILDRGGANARIRGMVLLDALYAGFDTFADWIAKNRSTFFISSYTTHTEGHNAELKHLLSERSVAFSTELKPDHLQGSVTFLPTGDISHRDFVNHAWADYPVADILERMTDVIPKTAPANVAASGSPSSVRHN
ncbi:MAG TPA: alpha/beta hydrolase [Xanthobacteraceae bacterium]|jgi:hypothetical protein